MICPLCSNEKSEVVYPKTRSGKIVKCSECGFVYSDPGAATGGADDKKAVVDSQENYRQNARHRLDTLHKATGIESGRLLDVGCYTGTFAAAAKAFGYEVFGVEAVAEAAKQAAQEHAFRVYQGFYEDVKIDAAPFDVISFIHSFEHMENPRAALSRSKKLLAENGALLIELPDFDGWSRRVTGASWRQFIADHRLFYTQKTLARALESEGFAIKHAANVPKQLSVRLFADRIERYYSRPVGKFMEKSARALGFAGNSFSLNLGDILLVVAKHKEFEK